MDLDICYIYRQLCLKYKIPIETFILSCLHYARCEYGEFNLRNTTISDISCLFIAENLKLLPNVKILNLSDCLLSFDALKNFLDVVGQLKILIQLNIKGNQLGNNVAYVSKVLFNNSSIIDLQLEWNNIGSSIDSFSQFCNSLMSNTVLTILNLANNNLCQLCSFNLAKVLNINKCLKNIDLSWNNIGETGAVYLLKSLRNNRTLIELNIQGNSVSVKTSIMITDKLNQNKENKINQTNIQNRTLPPENVTSTDKNQIQLYSINSRYQNRIKKLESNVFILQEQNQQQKQEIEKLKSINLKEKESNLLILKRMKSELSLKEQSLNSLVKQISNEVANSDLEKMNSLEDLEKIIFIIEQIKKSHGNTILKETNLRKKILENVLKLTDNLRVLKVQLINLKSSTEIKLNDYSDNLIAVQNLLFINIDHLKISKKIYNEIHFKHLSDQIEEINICDKQIKTLVLLNKNFNQLHKEKKNLENKLMETNRQLFMNNVLIQTLENNLKLAQDKLLQYCIDKQRSDENAQLRINAFSKEIDTLKMNIAEKNHQLQLSEVEKHKMNINHESESLALREQLQLIKQKLEEKKKEDQNKTEELYLMFVQYFTKFKNSNLENINNNKLKE